MMKLKLIHKLLIAINAPYLQLISYIVVIASTVQLVEMFIKKMSPALFRQLGIFLPLITTNCAILGLALFQTNKGYNLLQGLVYALGAEYRANATFVMNSRTAGHIRKLKDADGRFVWLDGIAEAEPARLMGYRVLIAEDMPDIATDSYSIAFGDFGAGYTVAERPDLRVLRDPFSAKPHVLFYATKRVGGDVSDFAAIKLLKLSVS